MPLMYLVVRYRGEELLEIQQDDTTLTAIASKVPYEVPFEFAPRNSHAFPGQARSIVIDHLRQIRWEQDAPCVQLEDLPVLYLWRVDRPCFSTLRDDEMDIPSRPPAPGQHHPAPNGRSGE